MILGTKKTGGTIGTTPVVTIKRDSAQKAGGLSVSITLSEPAKRLVLGSKAQRSIVFGYDKDSKEIGLGYLSKAQKDSGVKSWILKRETAHNLGISFVREYGLTADKVFTGILKETDDKAFPFKAVMSQKA